MTIDEERLRALLAVATDPESIIPPSWWASFGRECAEELPHVLADLTGARERIAELTADCDAYHDASLAADARARALVAAARTAVDHCHWAEARELLRDALDRHCKGEP